MDLHISVIADFKSANPDIEVVDWCLSGHAWVMNRPQDTPRHINAKTWMSLNTDMIQAFQHEYDGFLSTFDGFLTGHVTAFVLLYAKYNKPILSLNTCRYDIPFCWSNDMAMLTQLQTCLRTLHRSQQLTIVSNNRADQEYTRLGTGICPSYNPSLCLYTNVRYAPTLPTFLLYTGTLPPHDLVTPRPARYAWGDICAYKGVIHFPYETSLMSLFEHFTSGCPLFLPSKQYWKANPTLNSVSKYWGASLPPALQDVASPDFWIDRSDVYTLFSSPNTYYFDSTDHLFDLLRTFTYTNDTEFRQAHIDSVKRRWNEILADTLAYRYRTQSPRHLCYNRLPLLANVVFDINYTNTGVTPQHTYPFQYPFRPGDVVFVKTDLLSRVLASYPITAPITLVTGVSDLSPSPEDCDFILRCELIRTWVGCNIPVSHPKIRKVLIGVGEPERPNGTHALLSHLHRTRPAWTDKLPSMCIPYHSTTHAERQTLPMLPRLPFEEYMKTIGTYKFVRCIRGNGLDTHRFTEILLMGSVPVVDHSPLDDLYRQFPCLFVEEDMDSFVWDDTKYDAFLDMVWLSPRNKENIIKPSFH